MGYPISKYGVRFLAAAIAGLICAPVHVHAQGAAGPGGPPLSPKASAPIDLTGYWVSLITEEWRYRMVTPAKGRLHERSDDDGIENCGGRVGPGKG